MAETEERPTKIRKLSHGEQIKGTLIVTPAAASEEIAPNCNNHETDEKGTEKEEAHTQSEKTSKLSKSQLKKLRRREQWEAAREYRANKRREKNKEKQARKREQRVELEAKIAKGEVEPFKAVETPDGQVKRPVRPVQIPVGLVLDCDFNDLMTEKEIISLGAQLTRCYSLNRSALYRTHLAISSWGGKLKSRFENVLASNHLSWTGVKFLEDEDFVAAGRLLHTTMKATGGGTLAGALAEEEKNPSSAKASLEESSLSKEITLPNPTEGLGHTETCILSGELLNISHTSVRTTESQSALPPAQPELIDQQLSTIATDATIGDESKIIYLTSDSPHTLSRLLANTTYIIGGIVDKNRHKGLCYKRACERGIATAKLPISEYLTMQSRSVLTINHVVEIMLKWFETDDWGEAFLSVIPKRKEAKLKIRRGEENRNSRGSAHAKATKSVGEVDAGNRFVDDSPMNTED